MICQMNQHQQNVHSTHKSPLPALCKPQGRQRRHSVVILGLQMDQTTACCTGCAWQDCVRSAERPAQKDGRKVSAGSQTDFRQFANSKGLAVQNLSAHCEIVARTFAATEAGILATIKVAQVRATQDLRNRSRNVAVGAWVEHLQRRQSAHLNRKRF